MKAEAKKLISEKFSEKKKRGRPRLLSPEWEKEIRQGRRAHFDIRTLHNEEYEARAVNVLGLSPDNPPNFPFLWLGDSSKIEYGVSERRGYRKTILAELGRIASDKNIVEAATEICRLKPKTQEAIKLIRSWRLRRASITPSLESVLHKALADYRNKNPDITASEIHKVLETLESEYLEKSVSEIFGK